MVLPELGGAAAVSVLIGIDTSELLPERSFCGRFTALAFTWFPEEFLMANEGLKAPFGDNVPQPQS